MSNYVVTGGTGFLGQVLATQLRQCGHNVIIASRHSPSHNRADDWVEFDLRDWATAANVANVRPDGVFHLAWSTTPATAEQLPAADIATNLSGTMNLLDQLSALQDVRVVIVSSGGAIYGEAGIEPITETQPPNPISIYGTTKLAMELYAMRCRRFADLDVRVARISNPFGAGQAPAKMQGAATIFARKIIKGEALHIWGDGQSVRDYIDVSDVASGLSAIMAIVGSHDESLVFNIGSGRGLSLIELITRLELALHRKADVRFGEPRSFDVPVNVLAISKLTGRTGWRPGDIDDRLRAFADSLCHSIDGLL